MMRCHGVWLGAFALLLAGCGATRRVWTYDRGNPPQSLETQHKYAIESFVITPRVGEGGDAVVASCAVDGRPGLFMVSKEWVDYLYEAYPKVFSKTGVPVRITAACGEPQSGEEALMGSTFRYVLGKIGLVTILPILPIESVSVYNWKVDSSMKGTKDDSCCVKETSELLISFSPLGLLCSYGDTTSGDFQYAGGMYENGEKPLRQLINALGAGIIVQLARLEQLDSVEGSFSEERKKNLDSLLKAGVIDEEEYRKEMEKAK